jgi:hypothetical protein
MIAIAFAFFMAVACGYAFVCGERSARIVAAVVVAGSIISIFVAEESMELWQDSEPGIAMVDITMLMIFAAIMLKSDRYWPIWTTAAQLLTVLAHLGPLLRNADIAVPFAISEQLWAWFILAQLIFVTAKRPAAKKRWLLRR